MNPKLKIRVIDSYVYKKSDNGFDFLILKRADTKIYEHLWQGVAGKIEKNEKSWQAAIRELKEETGLNPRKIFIADHVSKFYEAHQDRINFVPVFGIEVNNEKVILSNEHCDYKWVDFETASSHLVWSGQKKGIHAVNQMLLSNDDRMKWSLINFNNISIS
jgi:dATP pyrophosphohydrolase